MPKKKGFNNRGDYAIMYRILNIIARENGKGAIQARVMYGSYISFTQLQNYRDKMQSLDLIKVTKTNYDNGITEYVWDITKKGYILHDKLEEIGELLPSIL